MHGFEPYDARMLFETTNDFRAAIAGCLEVRQDQVIVHNQPRLREKSIVDFVYNAVFHPNTAWRQMLHWLIRACAAELEIHPASLYAFFDARGHNVIPRMTVLAFNLRTLSFDLARACLRAAHRAQTNALVFQLSPREAFYSQQSWHEYASCILGAAIREGHIGPVFLQVDQLALRGNDENRDDFTALVTETMDAGYFQYILDGTHLIDQRQPSEQDQLQDTLIACADASAFLRLQQPAGVTLSLGCEIPLSAEPNVTANFTRVFANSFLPALRSRGEHFENISKIALPTQTSVSDYPLPSQLSALEFEIANEAGELLQRDFHLAGAALHDVSSMPEALFDRLREGGICEAHMGTRLQDLVLDQPAFPEELKARLYRWLDETHPVHSGRKRGPQEYIENRKFALGAFKRELWNLGSDTRNALAESVEREVENRLVRLGLTNRARLVLDLTRIQRVNAPPPRSGLHHTAQQRLADLLA